VNLVQLLLAAALAGILLWIIVRHWKIALGLAVAGLLVGALLCVNGAVDCPFGKGEGRNGHDGPQGSTGPQSTPPLRACRIS
jgi:hypothetical protein